MANTQTIFVSYNQADRNWAEWIAWIVEEEGYRAIIQAWDFRGNFVLEMDRAAREAQQTIIVLSQNYLDAEFTHPEWAAAFVKDPQSAKNLLIPVRVAEVRPSGLLAQIVYVDFVGHDEDAARKLLTDRVKGIRGKPATQPTFPGRPAAKPKPLFPSAGAMRTTIWNVPHARNPKFTGRASMLDDLTTQLSSGQQAALVQAIAGLGGVGKTQIATEYAYRQQGHYNVVWWLRAGEPATLNGDYAALAEKLGLAAQNIAEQQAIVEAVRRWLDENRGWLLIFDNAEDQKSLQPYLPRNRLGHVIITSRNQAWSAIASPLKVKEMTQPEAVEFLLKDSASADAGQAAILAEELGKLPLALAQAKAYMDETGTTLDAYSDLFKEHSRELLAEARALDYPVSVAATWAMSFARAKAQSATAADLMNICAFLAPDDISTDLFFKGHDHLPQPLSATCQNELTFNQAIAALRRYSLVETGEKSLSYHRLVQAVARDHLTEPEQRHWAAIAGRLVSAMLPDDGWDARHWPTYKMTLPHAIAASDHLRRYGIAPEIAGRLLNAIGDYLRARANFSLAEAKLAAGLQLREDALGPNDPDTAQSLFSVGWLYKDLGHYNRAEQLAQRALDVRQTSLGLDHSDTARSLSLLGGLHQAQGQYPKAEPLFRRAFDIQEKVLGPDHPDTAGGLNNLAGLYKVQGQYPKAEPLYRRALDIGEKVLGPDHPNTATGLNNLASLYHAQGQYPKAEPLYRRALDIQEKVLGPDHPDTALGLNNLAGLYQTQGQYLKAEPLYRRALDIQEKALGPDHPDRALGLNNLAMLYEVMRRKPDAEALFRRALEIRERLLETDPDNLMLLEGCKQSGMGVARTSARNPMLNSAKAGRNDPCPCGSGVKFKRCGMIDAACHIKAAS